MVQKVDFDFDLSAIADLLHDFQMSLFCDCWYQFWLSPLLLQLVSPSFSRALLSVYSHVMSISDRLLSSDGYLFCG